MNFHLIGSVADTIFTVLIYLSVIAVFVSIIIDFENYNGNNSVKKSKRSIVSTGSMIGFYIIYYLILRFQMGRFEEIAKYYMICFGTLMIVVGAVINITARVQLKGNWANHIKIYKNHTLVNRGIFRIVRHPLYASIMLMLFGGSFVYRNWLSAAATVFVFIPFMYYRAKQEETFLRKEFIEYEDYSKRTGMFFPKLF